MEGRPTVSEMAGEAAEFTMERMGDMTDKQVAKLYLAVKGEAYERKMTEQEMEEMTR